jgi:hypothetical protein
VYLYTPVEQQRQPHTRPPLDDANFDDNYVYTSALATHMFLKARSFVHTRSIYQTHTVYCQQHFRDESSLITRDSSEAKTCQGKLNYLRSSCDPRSNPPVCACASAGLYRPERLKHFDDIQRLLDCTRLLRPLTSSTFACLTAQVTDRAHP